MKVYNRQKYEEIKERLFIGTIIIILISSFFIISWETANEPTFKYCPTYTSTPNNTYVGIQLINKKYICGTLNFTPSLPQGLSVWKDGYISGMVINPPKDQEYKITMYCSFRKIKVPSINMGYGFKTSKHTCPTKWEPPSVSDFYVGLFMMYLIVDVFFIAATHSKNILEN
jgi:hypothetical protein